MGRSKEKHPLVLMLEQKRKLIVAVVCTQFGDTGKGKVIDGLGPWADVVVRGTGGANAGHTICVGDATHVFHLLPSGILHDRDGKINVIGSGVAFDPKVCLEEIAILEAAGLSVNGLHIALNAPLVLPQHILADQLQEVAAGVGKIGTTGRGVGPVYVDRVARVGLMVNDLLNPEVFERKLRRNIASKTELLRQCDLRVAERVLQSPLLGSGEFFSPDYVLDVEAIVKRYLEYGLRLGHHICDTDKLVREAKYGGKRILLEGAQGVLLSLKRGTYPFVTSSDASLAGLAEGAGLKESDVDYVFGLAKAFYMSRVGEGPFPTEMGGEQSAAHCRNPKMTRAVEALWDHDINSSDPFYQGLAIREAGDEFGATTGRPRRVGWLDIPLLRYALEYAGGKAKCELLLTKLDVLRGCKEIKLCTGYTYVGDEYSIGKRVLKRGETLDVAIVDSYVLKNCEPIFEYYPGWDDDIRDVRHIADLPQTLKDLLMEVEKIAGYRVSAVSVGPERDQVAV